MDPEAWATANNPVPMLAALYEKKRVTPRLLRLAATTRLRLLGGDELPQPFLDIIRSAECYALGQGNLDIIEKYAMCVHYMQETKDVSAKVRQCYGLLNYAIDSEQQLQEQITYYESGPPGNNANMEPQTDVAADSAMAQMANALRAVFGPTPDGLPDFDPAWRTDTVLTLAKQMYETRNFAAMPILADALQDIGCENEDILNHCRDIHHRFFAGDWVLETVLGPAQAVTVNGMVCYKPPSAQRD